MPEKNMTRMISGIVFGVGLVAVWQLVYYIGVDVLALWKSYAFPSPIGVIISLKDLIKNGSLFWAIISSLRRALAGFIIAVILGIAIGILITNIDYLNRNMKPLLLGVQSLPSICWVPFAILWFGINEAAIIFVVVAGSVFSVSLAVEQGIRMIPPIYIKAAKTMGAKKGDLYRYIIFPAVLPQIIAGLKQAWSFAWRALMSGEVMSASIGLGYSLMLGRDMADINQVMAVMLIIILVGILVDKVAFSMWEKRILKKRGL